MHLRGGVDAIDIVTSLAHRRLEYYGSPNYVVMFVLTGILGTYTLRYIVYPRCKKLHHYITKRRINNTLDQYDNIDFEEMMERTAPRIDPETGELFMGKKEEKLTETQAMAQMLKEQKEAELAAYAEEHKYDDVILGPDGKPLLEAAEFDEYGNVIESKDKKKDGKKKDKKSIGAVWDEGDGDDEEKKEDDLDAPPKTSHLKKKKPDQRKLSPKKLALIEQKRKEDEEFRKAYAKSLKIPSVEDRVKVVKEEFEKYMLFGKEPLGYQLKLETRKRLEQEADKEQFMTMRRSNYFHKLVEKEWIESEREKHRKVKFDRPRSAHTLGLDYDYGEGRNAMGFEGKRKGAPEAGSRDSSVVSRGFGSLPTRPDSPAQKEKRGRARSGGGRLSTGDEKQYFARDGSGRPASEQEKQEMIKEAEARSRSNSPNGRSPSPEQERTSRSPPREPSVSKQRKRPMTANQFRRAYF